MIQSSAMPPMATDAIARFSHAEKLRTQQMMRSHAEAMARAAAHEMEQAILRGCAKCGKQIVVDGKTIEGARLLGRSMIDAIWNGNVEPCKAYCQECLQSGV